MKSEPTSLPLPLPDPADADADADAAAATRRWLERAVIGLNLCPFAGPVAARGLVHYAVSAAESAASLRADLERELDALVGLPAGVRETTLLIAPRCLADFIEFNAFMRTAERLLVRRGYEGVIQLASFHPDYEFGDGAAGDISHYTNRSPHPTIHLLREASVERAVAARPDTDAIFQANLQTMRRLGHAGWTALLAQERS